MKFKELRTNEIFEFDHSDLTVGCYQIAHGPWVKLDGRQYVRPNGGFIYRVGSIYARVRKGENCGRR